MFRQFCGILGIVLFASLNLSAQNYDKMTIEDILATEVTMLFKSKSTPLKAPGIITIISRSEIERSGARYLSEILNYSIGIEANRSILFGTHTTLGIRGRTTEFGEDILVLLDGQRLNDVFSGGGLQLVKDLSLNHIDRIEIIRGPGSTLFGSNAFVGVINIISSKYETTDKQRLSIAGGSFEAVEAGVSMRWNSGKLRGLVTANTRTDDGEDYQYSQAFFRLPGQVPAIQDPIEEQLDVGVKLGFENLNFQVDWFKREMDSFMPWGFFSHEWENPLLETNRDDSEMTRVQANYDWEVNKALTLSAAMRYNRSENEQAYFIAPEGVNVAGVVLNEGWMGGPNHEMDNAEFEVRLNYIKGDHEFITGAVVARDRLVDSNLIFNFTIRDIILGNHVTGDDWLVQEGDAAFVDKQDRDIRSIYIQDTWYPNSKWGITAGIRYDDYNDFGDSINPRLAAVYNLSEVWVLKLLYGRAFRAPTFSELYTRNLPNALGNPDLKAQTIDTVETSVYWSAGPQFSITVSTFYSYYQDLIKQAFSFDTAQSYFNGEDGDNDYGVELDTQWRIVRGTNLRLGYAYVKSEDHEGNRRLFSPEHKATLSFSHEFGKRGLISLSGFYHGSRLIQSLTPAFTVENVEMDGSTVLSAHGRLRDLVPHLDLELTLFNLTDEEWYSPGFSPVLAPENVLNRGFEYQLKASYNY
ncbi:TonB-dependent receptor [Sulfidibacter corallicola]|uniref:TonB-dependent receptor n=1 Tax=Sulfidibacter corallicola TaxID=2818388 RepID=A0A8A4TE69_SULCO|nr:TonB-dependent receptor [Sulfidibacter corallicola]QTD47532.1 TonB-dependent receptor [Sulfidibacter corallicola]